MFVRFRQTQTRLQVSLIATRRVDGKVRHEHIAGLGSIRVPVAVADRVAFWAKLHERLAKLDNRIDATTQGKIFGDIHARIPMVTPHEQRALQLENAEADERFWSMLHDMHASTVAGHKELKGTVEQAITTGQAEMAKTSASATAAQERIERIERIEKGEDVPGGLGNPITREDMIKQLGFTRHDLRRMEHQMAIGELGKDAWQEFLREYQAERLKHDHSLTITTARKVLNRRFSEASEDKKAAARKVSMPLQFSPVVPK